MDKYSVIEDSKVINNETGQVLYEFNPKLAVTYEYMYYKELGIQKEMDFTKCFFVLGDNVYFILFYLNRRESMYNQQTVLLKENCVRILENQETYLILKSDSVKIIRENNEFYIDGTSRLSNEKWRCLFVIWGNENLKMVHCEKIDENKRFCFC